MKKKFYVGIAAILMICMSLAACGSPEDSKKPSGETVAVTSVELDKSSLTLEVGGTYTLAATVLPENATDKKLTYSADGAAVTVDNGRITAVEIGAATVTATSANGLTATCAVKVVAADDGQERKKDGWIYYEDFSERVAVPQYFDKDVVGFSRVELEDGALRFTVINGGSGDHAFFVHKFDTALPAQFVIDMRVQSDSLAFANLMFMYARTENYTDVGNIAACVAMDKGAFKVNSGSGWNKSVFPYATGTAYDVKLTVDARAQAFWLTVDGVASGRLPFRNNIADIAAVRFGSETAWADVSYERIGVREATAADLAALPTALDYVNDFDGTAKPGDITAAQTAGGSVDFSTDGEVTLSTPTSGTVTLDKKFDRELDGTYAAEVTFKNLSSASNTFANVLFLRNSALSGTAGNIVTVAVESGNLRYHNGSSWKTVPHDGGNVRLIDGAWYTLSVVCNESTQKYKLYLSGERYINDVSGEKPLGEKVYLGEFDFRNKSAGKPDSIEIAIGTGKAGTRFTVDKIKVYETNGYEL